MQRRFLSNLSLSIFCIIHLGGGGIIPSAAASSVGLRATPKLPSTSVVECLYAKKAITDSDGNNKFIDQCIINYNGHIQDLPQGLIDQNVFVSGQSAFKIHGARIVRDEKNIDNIEVQENAIVEIMESQSHARRNLVTTTGTHIVLIIRVTSVDGQIPYDGSTIGKLVFGDNGSTLKNVYGSCSFGKLTMTPYKGQGVVTGVAELFFNGNVTGQNPQEVENLISGTIHATYGYEGIAFDHLMIMLPPGTQPGFLAYSYIGYYRSVFNNDWSGYVSAHVHEVGHTLGLQHSSRNGNEYMDQTGFMGYSYASIGSPAKCFNGHKNYVLGWYSDRLIEIVPSMLPWTGNLVAFVDYSQSLSDEAVVIKINDLHLQYNRAKAFNYQTRQNQDEVTITQAANASVISTAVGSVSMSNTTYTVINYQGIGNLIIEACSQQSVVSNGRADLYWISINLASQPSGCFSALSINVQPTAAPVLPTPSPVHATVVPSPTTPPPTSATPKPVAPTSKPTSIAKPPRRQTRSPRKTSHPISSPPTSPPTIGSPPNLFQQVLTSAPSPGLTTGTKCVDSSTGTFRYKAQSRTCQWLNARPSQQSAACGVGGQAYQLCRATCKSC